MKSFVIAVFVVLSGMVSIATAQEQAPPSAQSSANPLDTLVTIMKDETLRNQLITEIEGMRDQDKTQATATSQTPAAETAKPADTPPAESAAADNGENEGVMAGHGLLAGVVGWLRELGEQLPTAALGAPIDVKFAQAENQINRRLAAPQATDNLQAFAIRAFPGWALGTIAALFVLVLVRRRTRTRITKGATLAQVSRQAALRALLAVLPLAACLVFAALWSRLLGFSENNGLIFFILAVPFAIALAVSEIISCLLLLLAPSKGWRLVAYAQRKLSPIVGILTGVATAGSLTEVPDIRAAIGPATADIASLFFDLAVPLLALYIVFRHRRIVRALIVRGHTPAEDTSPMSRITYWFGAHWHHLGILFVVLNIGARLFGAQTGDFLTQSFLSVAIIVIAMILSAMLQKVSDRRSSKARNAYYKTMRMVVLERLGAVLFQLVKIALVVIAVVACLGLWGIDAVGWMNSSVGSSIIGPLISILVMTLLAWSIWVVLDAWISDVLSPADARNSRERSARVKTLLPLLRNVAFVALSVMTVIGILSNLGINVAPLIAGAGVVGLAIGFGSQQLVADVITGLFILLEDTLAIGDVVDTGDRVGTVEALTIRTVKIRDGDGALHSVPFSTIKALKNSSRGFGVYTVAVTLDTGADVEKALDILKDVGDEVAGDPQFSAKIVAPLDVWGVDQVSLDGIVIKGAIKTLPLQQYGVGRAINRRYRDRLQESGIRLATRMTLPGVQAAA